MSAFPASDTFDIRRHNPPSARPQALEETLTINSPTATNVGLESPVIPSERGYSVDSPATRIGVATPTDDDYRMKAKQRRNKPTLSCEECVERKTKVRRYQHRRA